MLKHLFLILGCISLLFPEIQGCTTAIIGADKSKTGRPLLWKHRDTSSTDNIVEYVSSGNGAHAYVALFNASDTNLEEAWTGMNDAGFAIMNSASYNLKNDNVPDSDMDQEGRIMTMALKNCKTVDDFAALLDSLPKPLGVEANFGVIDAYGNGAYFETDNFNYKRFNIEDEPDHILIRTNFSFSGIENEGFGYVRYNNAKELLDPYLASGEITAELLTEDVSRSFLHSMLDKDFLASGDKWAIDQDFIPRYKSTATIVIEGCRPLEKSQDPDNIDFSEEYIMWTGLGYPPVAEIVPVWCRPDGVAEGLRASDGKTSSICNLAKERRAHVFDSPYDNADKYVNLSVLVNNSQTGYLQTIVPKNREVYRLFGEKRDAGKH